MISGSGLGNDARLGEVAQIRFQIVLELGEVERDIDLARAAVSSLPLGASRQSPDHVVVEPELVPADIADG